MDETEESGIPFCENLWVFRQSDEDGRNSRRESSVTEGVTDRESDEEGVTHGDGSKVRVRFDEGRVEDFEVDKRKG